MRSTSFVFSRPLESSPSASHAAWRLLASQNVQESTKVQRSLSHNRVDVGIRGPSIGHVQLEALGEFREAVTRELLQDGATRTWGEANH